MVSILAPKTSAFDEDIAVVVEGLCSGQKITITLQTSRNDVTMTSFARFEAGDDGRVDVTKLTALPGGTYEGLEPMGLFWSMAITGKSKVPLKMVSGKDIGSLDFVVQVHDGHLNSMDDALAAIEKNCPLARTTIERQLVQDGVQRVEVRRGKMRGLLFIPPGKGPFPAVINVLGGANGMVAYQGGQLARHGYACLCVAYQAYEDLPREMTVIESDYFNECYEYLASHPSIDKDGIGFFGECHGATMGLALARCQPGIRAVAVICPQPFATAGSWNLRIGEVGEDGLRSIVTIPGVEWNLDLMKRENGTADLRPMTQHSAPGDWRVHSLEFGKVKAPLLIFYGTDDKIFDFDWSMAIIREQLENENKTNFEIVEYKDCGHAIRIPHFPVVTQYYHPVFKLEVLFGGNIPIQAKAQDDMWNRTLAFFRRHLVEKL